MSGTPANFSRAQSSKWKAHIEGLDGITFELKDFFIPSATLGMSDIGVGGPIGIKYPGDRIVYDNISLEFFVTVDWSNYRAAYEWMQSVASDPSKTRQITVMLLNGQGRPQGVNVTFIECFPMSLSPVMLDSTNEVTDITINLDVAYESFDFC